MSYEEIYKMKPISEDKEGWCKLMWKPIWFGTFFIYHEWSFGVMGKRIWHRNPCLLGFTFYTGNGAHNGWHRSYDMLDISIGLIFVTIRFWIKYNYIVHKDGPSDVSDKKPLIIKKEEQNGKTNRQLPKNSRSQSG